MLARANLQIKVGSYTGDGNDNRAISGIGFRPHLVMIKGGSNLGMFRTREMPRDQSAYMAGSTINEADNIQEMLADGFQVGTNAKVNANGTVYYYIAIRGAAAQKYFATGRYVGTGGDNRDFNAGGVPFTPDFFTTKQNNTNGMAFRSSAMGADNSAHFGGLADAANEIQSLISGGAQLGTSARVNASAEEYFFFALKALAGYIAFGTYTGDAVDDRKIEGIGFAPDVVIVKNGTTTNNGYVRTSAMSGDGGFAYGASGQLADTIQSLDSDGFTIGANSVVNGSTNTFWWIALKAGDFQVPLSRLAA